MSVIAKMYVVGEPKRFPNGAFYNLGCQYDADLSTASNEDVRFTQATPWGEASFTVEDFIVPRLGAKPGSTLYFLYSDEDDRPNIDTCEAAIVVSCKSITDFGHSRQVELTNAFGPNAPANPIDRSRRLAESFHCRMTIDNPGASLQFKPGKNYWLTVYRCDAVTLDEALSLARRGVS